MQGEQVAYAFEIKLGTAPKVNRGNTESANDLMPAHKVIIYSNEDAYPLRDDWKVMGIGGFLEGWSSAG
jgi:hypothetical protein